MDSRLVAPPHRAANPRASGRSEFYDVEGWKSGRRTDLYPLLVSEVGDVAGKDLSTFSATSG
jgi:hypothetical protein